MLPSRLLLAAVAALVLPAQAIAADVVSPRDGETVPSRPFFSFDVSDGAVDLEVSRTPDVLTAGDRAGAFVDPVGSSFFLLPDNAGDDPGESAGVYRWEESRLLAGRYYFRAAFDPLSSDKTWTSVRSFVVADEPPIFEGWTLQAKRLKRTKRCKARLAVTGKLVWSDNDAEPQLAYTLKLLTGTKTVSTLRGKFGEYDDRVIHTVCLSRPLPARALRASAAIRDRAGQVATVPPRDVTLS